VSSFGASALISCCLLLTDTNLDIALELNQHRIPNCPFLAQTSFHHRPILESLERMGNDSSHITGASESVAPENHRVSLETVCETCNSLVLETIVPGGDLTMRKILFDNLRRSASNGCPACSVVHKGILSCEKSPNDAESVVPGSYRKGGTLSVVLWKSDAILQHLEFYPHSGGFT
jgi:hypothetical protein